MRHLHPPRVPFRPVSLRGWRKPPALPAKGVTALLAAAGVLATVAITPANAASNTALTPHPRPPARHLSQAAPPPLLTLPHGLQRRHGVPVIPAQPPKPRSAHPHVLPKPARNIGSYRVSAAVMAFLHQGLGLPVTGSPVLTGMRTGHTITVTTGSGPNLDFGLPRGITAPSFSRARLVVDPAAGTVTITAAAPHATLLVTITNAATATLTGGADLSSRLTLRTALPGLLAGHDPMGLNGTLSYQPGRAASVDLLGSLPAAVTLAAGRAELGAGTRVTVATASGTRVSGPAVLGPGGHAVDVTVSGTLAAARDLSLNVTGRTGAASLLPGLALTAGAAGTLTDVGGSVGFDVRIPAAGTWTPARGVTIAGGTAEYSDTLPAGRVLAAPGIAAGTPWVDVTGAVTLPGGVSGHGTLAANLSSGAAVLAAAHGAPVTLAAAPARTVLSQADFGGVLTVGPAGISGPVRGTGLVTVTDPGRRPALADARFGLSAGVLTANFPLDRSVLGLGPAGSLDTAYWTSAASTVPGPSGAAIRLPAGLSATGRGSTLATSPRPVTAAPVPANTVPVASTAGTADTTSTYTLSSGVYNFLAQTLGLPVSSPTISGTLSGQTLTLTVGAPGPLPLTLPAGVQAPVFGDTTITVNESTNTLTLDTSATAGVTATLQVTITSANSASMTDGTDLSSSLTLGNVPFVGGSTVSLAGSLGYSGGSLTASLTGTLTSALSIANGAVVLQPGTSVTLATGTGLVVNGAAQIGSDANSFAVSVTGSLTDLSNWSLTVADTSPTWDPVASLQVNPDFSGTVTDTSGSVAFDLKATANPVVSWTPGSGATVSLSSLEVSNLAPPAGADCPSSVAAGDVWFGAAGSFSYVPANVSGLTAQACVDLTAQKFQVTTTTGTNLTGLFSGLPVQVTQATLTAGNISGSFAVTGGATLQINQGTTGITGQPSFANAGLSLSPSGIIVGVQISNLSTLSSSLSGSGALYLSTSAVQGFDPGTLPGLSGNPFNLPQGIAVSLDYTVPQSVAAAIGDPSLAGQSQQAVASLGSSGFSVDLSLNLGTGANGVQLINNGGFGFYLNDVNVSFAAGATTGVSVTVGGDAYLVLPALVQDGNGSDLEVSLDATLSAGDTGISGNVGISYTGTWTNAFGVSGLSVSNLGASLGIADGFPTFAFTASDVSLSGTVGSTVENAIGMASTATFSITGDISPTTPALALSLNGNGGPALLPLMVFSSDPDVYDSWQIYQASLYLAPFPVTIGGLTFAAGYSVAFSSTLYGVGLSFNGSVDPDPSAPSASFALQITGGLPSSLSGIGVTGIGGSLSGSLNTSGFSVSGYGTLYAAGGSLGSVGFSLSIPGGFNWNAGLNSVEQLAQFLLNEAENSVTTVAQILWNLGYSEFDIINSLGNLGQYGNWLLNTLASAFGFSTTYFDIWNTTSSGQSLVLDVNGGSQAPNTGIDTWLWNNGYNQDWEFVQSPYSGWYEIVSRGSGQCLSVSGPSTAPGTDLVQYPCFGGANQIWYMGNVALATYYQIASLYDYWYGGSNYDQVIDIQNAYPWEGGTVDVWPANGGWNQSFYLTNSHN